MTVFVVLTTAVIPNVHHADLRDPRLRRAQYLASTAFWRPVADGTAARLLVLDCTGIGIATTRDELELPADVLVRSFAPAQDLLDRGKGAIEAAAIDELICADGIRPEDTFYKVTGRLIVRNAADLLRPLADRQVMLRRRVDNSWADTRFFGMRASTWAACYTGMATQLDDFAGVWLEHVMAARTMSAALERRVVETPFAHPPMIVGQSGSHGHRYRAGALTQLRARATRPVARVVHAAARRTWW